MSEQFVNFGPALTPSAAQQARYGKGAGGRVNLSRERPVPIIPYGSGKKKVSQESEAEERKVMGGSHPIITPPERPHIKVESIYKSFAVPEELYSRQSREYQPSRAPEYLSHVAPFHPVRGALYRKN